MRKVGKFKYLGEVIQPNADDTESYLVKTRNMELAFQLPKNLYHKKSRYKEQEKEEGGGGREEKK